MKTNFELDKLVITGKEEKDDFSMNLEGIKVSTEYSAQELIEILKHDTATIEKLITLVKPIIDKVVKNLK